MTKRKKREKSRSVTDLSTLDSFLKDQGKLEEFQAIAIKEVLAEPGARRTAAAPSASGRKR